MCRVTPERVLLVSLSLLSQKPQSLKVHCRFTICKKFMTADMGVFFLINKDGQANVGLLTDHFPQGWSLEPDGAGREFDLCFQMM